VSAANGAGSGPRAEIAAALDNGDPVLAALGVLGLALGWSAEVLGSAATAAPADAFRAVAAADQSLGAAQAFYDVLAALIAKAEPSGAVAADLRRHASRQVQLTVQLAPLRERLGELMRAEDRVRALIAEKAAIEARIDELERLERLAGYVSELRASRDRLAARAHAIEASVTAADAELAAAAGRLITLAKTALDDLAPPTRALLLQAQEKDAELQARLAEYRTAQAEAGALGERAARQLAEAEAELAQARTSYENIRAETDDRRTALLRYAQANRGVAEALAEAPPDKDAESDAKRDQRPVADPGPVARALLVLDEVQSRLNDVDALLADALAPGEPAGEG